jgi:DNA polymerase III epsilon subunit-like protein
VALLPSKVSVERSHLEVAKHHKRNTVALNTEITGFQKDGGSEELIQIGMKKDNGATLYRLFLPSGPFSESAVKTHGLTMEKLKKEGTAPFGSDDAKEILDFAGPCARVIMHNKAFDIGVLLKAFKAVKVHLTLKGTDRWETLCTQELAKQLVLPETLEGLCTFFNIDQPQKHDALADASATL